MIEISAVSRLVRIAAPVVLAVSISSTHVLAQDTTTPDGIIHESEFQRLWAKNGDRWSAEDVEIKKRLAELEKKFEKTKHHSHPLG